ncbi:MAG: hypothetical protein HQL59_13955, partial [Magnetococcales bacterium]|nr:hypothetical protein [Magnetococcales bacterium]
MELDIALGRRLHLEPDLEPVESVSPARRVSKEPLPFPEPPWPEPLPGPSLPAQRAEPSLDDAAATLPHTMPPEDEPFLSSRNPLSMPVREAPLLSPEAEVVPPHPEEREPILTEPSQPPDIDTDAFPFPPVVDEDELDGERSWVDHHPRLSESENAGEESDIFVTDHSASGTAPQRFVPTHPHFDTDPLFDTDLAGEGRPDDSREMAPTGNAWEQVADSGGPTADRQRLEPDFSPATKSPGTIPMICPLILKSANLR